MSFKNNGKNLKFAKYFITAVLVLIFFSLAFKFVFVLSEGKFDSAHKFVVSFVGQNRTSVVAFSPENNSISILKINKKMDIATASKYLRIWIDGEVKNSPDDLTTSKISSKLFGSFVSFGKDLKNLNFIDSLRLFLFVKSVPFNSVYQRVLEENLSNEQKLTMINLTFSNNNIYEENKSIQVINATDVYGLGSKLADYVSNLGGNVILVSSNNTQNESTITYYKDLSYTVRKINSYLKFKLIESTRPGVADVIITIGEDSIKNINL